MDYDQLKIELNYQRRLIKYNEDARFLKDKREQFYKDNPDFPIKTMYMQVTAPPQKVSFIKI